jgi:hypothetical protein
MELSTANLERIIISPTPTKNLMPTTVMFPSSCCCGVSSKVELCFAGNSYTEVGEQDQKYDAQHWT